jgi:hypothetical protein
MLRNREVVLDDAQCGCVLALLLFVEDHFLARTAHPFEQLVDRFLNRIDAPLHPRVAVSNVGAHAFDFVDKLVKC